MGKKKPFEVSFKRDTRSENPKYHHDVVRLAILDSNVPGRKPDCKFTEQWGTIRSYWFKEMKMLVNHEQIVPLMICPVTKHLLTLKYYDADDDPTWTYCCVYVQESYRKWLTDLQFEKQVLMRK